MVKGGAAPVSGDDRHLTQGLSVSRVPRSCGDEPAGSLGRGDLDPAFPAQADEPDNWISELAQQLCSPPSRGCLSRRDWSRQGNGDLDCFRWYRLHEPSGFGPAKGLYPWQGVECHHIANKKMCQHIDKSSLTIE